MSYGVALRNGVPFTLGTIAALCVNATTQWNPLSLWPDGIDSPGMWMSPRTLTSEWQDYTGTTPVVTPGTVADLSNPVGLALDIRAGDPPPLGPELVVNGDFSNGTTDWSITGGNWSVVGGAMQHTPGASSFFQQTRAVLPLGANKWFELQYTVSGRTAGDFTLYFGGSSANGYSGNGTHTIRFCDTGGSYGLLFDAGSAYDGAIDNISIKEIPGNHMLQSTSAARPLMSARVNLLTYTEDFSNAAWAVFAGPAKVGVAPIAGPSGSVAYEVSMGTVGGAIGGAGAFYQALSAMPEGLKTPSIYARAKTGTSSLRLSFTDQSSIYGSSDIAINDSSWTRLSFSDTPLNGFVSGNFAVRNNVAGNSGNVYLAEAQFQSGPLTDYQAILGNGYPYPSTGFPIAQLYDGVDDGMATAAFSAGTLTSAMDCMIAVRRDSAAACVAGLYNGIADATKFFGMAESASGSGCVGSGAGTPTVWVDNTQLTGGTAVTRGTLHTALTVGDWHILEFRNLDLSTWAAAGFGLYTSYLFTGARSDIMLYPSTDSTADKDAARQYLADYYGVTLP